MGVAVPLRTGVLMMLTALILAFRRHAAQMCTSKTFHLNVRLHPTGGFMRIAVGSTGTRFALTCTYVQGPDDLTRIDADATAHRNAHQSGATLLRGRTQPGTDSQTSRILPILRITHAHRSTGGRRGPHLHRPPLATTRIHGKRTEEEIRAEMRAHLRLIRRRHRLDAGPPMRRRPPHGESETRFPDPHLHRHTHGIDRTRPASARLPACPCHPNARLPVPQQSPDRLTRTSAACSPRNSDAHTPLFPFPWSSEPHKWQKHCGERT